MNGRRKRVTVSDRIVDDLRTGAYIEEAAAHAGVNKDAVYTWMRIGARAARSVLQGKKPYGDLTMHERECWRFADAVDQAKADWVLGVHERMESHARGGMTVKTVTEKTEIVYDEEGNGKERVVERTVKEEELPANWRVDQWRMERKDFRRYGRRVATELSGPDGDPIELDLSVEEGAAELADSIRRWRESQAIEAFTMGAAAANGVHEDEQAAADAGDG